MIIVRHKVFKKHFKKRISPNPKLVAKFKQRLSIFLKDSDNPVLRDHSLVGKRTGYRAFSVTGDIRVVYKRQGNNLFLYDIGSHTQVYGM